MDLSNPELLNQIITVSNYHENFFHFFLLRLLEKYDGNTQETNSFIFSFQP